MPEAIAMRSKVVWIRVGQCWSRRPPFAVAGPARTISLQQMRFVPRDRRPFENWLRAYCLTTLDCPPLNSAVTRLTKPPLPPLIHVRLSQATDGGYDEQSERENHAEGIRRRDS